MAEVTALIVHAVFSVENLAKIRKLNVEYGAVCDVKLLHHDAGTMQARK